MTGSTKVVQITNIAPQATKDQMQALFGSVGKIDEIRLYPTVRDVSCPVNSRICYVKYIDSAAVSSAQHLTNTVFIDRALIVIPVGHGTIPDEYRALEMSSNGTIVPGLQKQNFKLPDEVVNRIDGMVPNQVVKTDDPKLVEAGLPEYPALPVNYDARKIEETRRTIIVIDIPDSWKLDGLIEFFRPAGEVKYSRFAETVDGKRLALIEFCEQWNVVSALKMQGQEYDGRQLNLYHSTQPISKPEAKTNEAAQKEIEEAMSIVKEAHNMIAAAIDPVIGMLGSTSKKSRTRSRSRSRKRSKTRERSRSRDRRRKSRSRYSRSRSRSHRRKSRSRRSRSRSKRRRSRSREHRRRSRSRSRKRRTRSRDRRRRSYSRDKKRSHRKDDRRRKDDRSRSGSRASSRKKHKERKRSRTRSKSRRSSIERTTTSRTRDAAKKREKSREKPLKRISEEPRPPRDYDAEEKIGLEDEAERRSPSVEAKVDDMDISTSP